MYRVAASTPNEYVAALDGSQQAQVAALRAMAPCC